MRIVLTEAADFTANMTNRWGENFTMPGQIVVGSSQAGGWQDSGAMFAGKGFGYGSYHFNIATSNDTVAGPYALLWPASGEKPGDDVWPGPEIDVLETGTSKGIQYGAKHWDADPSPSHVTNSDDRWEIYAQPDHDARRETAYGINWYPDRMEWTMNGKVYASTTEHVPKDAAHGGVNMLPGIGVHLWPDLVDQLNHVPGHYTQLALLRFEYDSLF